MGERTAGASLGCQACHAAYSAQCTHQGLGCRAEMARLRRRVNRARARLESDAGASIRSCTNILRPVWFAEGGAAEGEQDA
jgi:hypothetical protein